MKKTLALMCIGLMALTLVSETYAHRRGDENRRRNRDGEARRRDGQRGRRGPVIVDRDSRGNDRDYRDGRRDRDYRDGRRDRDYGEPRRDRDYRDGRRDDLNYRRYDYRYFCSERLDFSYGSYDHWSYEDDFYYDVY